MERTNFRHLTADMLVGPPPTAAVIDVSFISLKLILPVLRELLPVNSFVVALIKPQFEAGRDQVGKSGVVREPATHLQVLQEVTAFAASIQLQLQQLTFSPITGGEGNIEFLAYWSNTSQCETSIDLSSVVAAAHQTLT
jgi:23S rRNA (cytidine1920-2'-O)/16S rRNA (cytidine1409-2'-O)-methyltransferase